GRAACGCPEAAHQACLQSRAVVCSSASLADASEGLMNVKTRPSFGTHGVWLVALALSVFSTAPPSASTPAPQKGGNKTVFVAVVDADGNPVSGMTKDEWGVREDGADRVIVDIKPATQPLDIVLMVDTTKSTSPSIQELR